MSDKVIVINREPGDLEVGHQFSLLAENTALHHQDLNYLGEHEISPRMVEYIFEGDEGQSRLVLTDDYSNDITYISMKGFSEYVEQLLSNWILNNLPTENLESIREKLDNDIQKNSRLLLHLGMMETLRTSDPKTISIIERALNMDDQAIRDQAITAIGLIRSPQFKIPLQKAIEDLQNEHSREFASMVLEQI